LSGTGRRFTNSAENLPGREAVFKILETIFRTGEKIFKAIEKIVWDGEMILYYRRKFLERRDDFQNGGEKLLRRGTVLNLGEIFSG
jgi:hypothetical protein